METLTYSEFSRRVHAQTGVRRIPMNGTIEITNRCPLTCSHCYNNLPMDDVAARRSELSFDEHLRLLDELADLGCLWLLYSGGEIFARRDFLDIYEYAKRKGFLITLFTNGILIDERVADRLAAMPPFAIEITLYGRTKETYEALTRIPGSFEKCMRGIDLLIERGLPLKLKTVGVSVNKHEIFDMKAYATERGLDFNFDAMINPRIDCSSAPLAVRLSPSDIVELDLRDPSRVSEWQRLARQFAPAIPPPGETPQLYDCGAGVSSFAVDPYGDVTMCVLSHFDKANLRDGSFAEGWEMLQGLRVKPATRPSKCTACNLRSMCGMCPAMGELENGDPEAPVDFLCHVAHLRAEAFEIETPPHGDCEYCGSKHGQIVAEAAAIQSAARDLPAVPSLVQQPEASCGSGGCSSCQIR